MKRSTESEKNRNHDLLQACHRRASLLRRRGSRGENRPDARTG